MDTTSTPGRTASGAAPQKYVPTHRWARGAAPALTIASRWLTIERRRAGEPVKALAARFPHALNAISTAWDDPERVLAVIDDLLSDRRGGRLGLPTDALAETLSLRMACEARIAEGPRAVPCSAPGSGGPIEDARDEGGRSGGDRTVGDR
jgi:hypothetical protein